MSCNGVDVSSHVELMSDAGDDRLKRADRRKLDGGQEALSARHVRNRDGAMQPLVRDGTPIQAPFNDLQAVNAPNGNVAACSNDKCLGFSARYCTSVFTNSANVPLSGRPRIL